MPKELSVGEVIDISIDVQRFIEHARMTKENIHPCLDCSLILEIESAAQAKLESFSCDWYSLLVAIAENGNTSRDGKIFTLEAIANDASKLILD